VGVSFDRCAVGNAELLRAEASSRAGPGRWREQAVNRVRRSPRCSSRGLAGLKRRRLAFAEHPHASAYGAAAPGRHLGVLRAEEAICPVQQKVGRGRRAGPGLGQFTADRAAPAPDPGRRPARNWRRFLQEGSLVSRPNRLECRIEGQDRPGAPGGSRSPEVVAARSLCVARRVTRPTGFPRSRAGRGFAVSESTPGLR